MNNIQRVLAVTLTSLSLLGCGANLVGMAEKTLYPFKDVDKSYPVPAVPPTGYEQKYFPVTASDGTPMSIHAWYHKAANPRARVLVYFHGNGENLEAVRQGGLLQLLSDLGFSVVTSDFPGLGRSTGFPDEANLTNAGLAVLSWARSNFPQAPVIVWGRSLGAAVAAQVVSKTNVNLTGLVLTSPWASFIDLAKDKTSLAGNLPKDWLAKHSYDTEKAVKDFRVDTLIHHGNKDTTVPLKFGKRVQAAFVTGVSKFVEIDGFGHNDIFRSEVLWNDVKNFHLNN